MTAGIAVPVEASPSADEVVPNYVGDDSADDVVDRDVQLRRAKYLAKRLRLVLFDLGLDHRLPSWLNATEFGLDFAPLNHRDAELLVKALEHVVGFQASSVRRPNAGQLPLF